MTAISISPEPLERRRLLAASLVSDPSTAHSHPYEIAAYGGRAYFPAEDVAHGRELWTSDGTPEGTRLVKDAEVGPSGIYPRDMTTFRGLLYFINANFTDRLYWAKVAAPRTG